MKKKGILITLALFVLLTSVCFADSFVNSNHYYSYSGGFNKNFLGSNGKHWTKYSIYQPAVRAGVWSKIYVAGRGSDYSAGQQSSYALSQYSVDFYHQHTHSYGHLSD